MLDSVLEAGDTMENKMNKMDVASAVIKISAQVGNKHYINQRQHTHRCTQVTANCDNP